MGSFPNAASYFKEWNGINSSLGSCAKRPACPTNPASSISTAIEETRGYHADGFGPKVKSFLYLDDVSSTDDGPYCFGLGTNEYIALRECNIDLYERFSDELKGTTFNFWDRRREVKFLGRAGDFGMTFQRGAHRGWPQKSVHHRYALVQTFMPEGMEP